MTDQTPEADERTAESIAANLEAWATYLDQWARLIRYAPSLPKLAGECAPQLRDAAAWIREQEASR